MIDVRVPFQIPNVEDTMTDTHSARFAGTPSVWNPAHPVPTEAALPPRADVVIAGGGIAGMCAAVQLSAAGLAVVVVDAIGPAAGTTGHSSAKVTLLHELHAHRIARLDGEVTARNYLDANQYGLDWIADQIKTSGIDCGWERQPAMTYVTSAENSQLIDEEVRAFTTAGIAASRIALDLPYSTQAAIRVADQGQFDPVRFVDGLVAQFKASGGTLISGPRATGVKDGGHGATVHTSWGDIACRWFIVATGLPFLDRGLFFARTEPMSSYVIACEVEQLPPDGMYLSADGPTRSLRTALIGDRRLLLVGGEGHKTGQGGDTRTRYEDLATWTDRHFGLVEEVNRFSANDFTTGDLRPFVGPIHPGPSSTLVATGFNKWGFTNAAAGGELLRSHILDSTTPRWASAYSPTRLPISGATNLIGANANVGMHMLGGWADAMRGHDSPEAGEGRVTRRRGRPVAVSRDEDGRECAVSGVCSHLGGILNWNPAERTWDCPLHGSRFASSGQVLQGPATTDLERNEP